MTTTPDHTGYFLRRLRALESLLYRQSKGGNIRNREPDPRAYCRQMWELIKESDQLADRLDTDEKLAARFNRAERRAYGLRP
jgi:hypothetical protein